MSLYAALYGNPRLPDSFQCICGRTFRPEKDKETYCSSRCAREDSMRGLLGSDTLYKQNALSELNQARQPLLERKPKKVKKVPSRLDLQKDAEDAPPTPLPKSARHIPQNRHGQSKTKTHKVPPVPLLVLDTTVGKSRDIPPTPPPKSARHMRRVPRHQGRSEPPPVPALPSQHMQVQPSMKREARAESQVRSEGVSGRVAANGTGMATGEQRSAAQQPAPRPSYAIYADPPQKSTPGIRRSNSLPFLQRVLDPSTKLGAQYHPPQRPAIYAPPTKQAVPLSPPPAYTSGGIYSAFSSPIPAVSKAHTGRRTAAKNHGAGSRGHPPATLVAAEMRQSKSVDHMRTSSFTSSRVASASQGVGDVWKAVRELRIDDDVDYRDRFLNRRTPRY